MWRFFQQFARSVSPSTEQGVDERGLFSLELFPNPADDHVTVSVVAPRLAAYRIVVFDLAGRTVLISRRKTNQSAGAANGMDLSGLPAGFYLVALADERNILHAHTGLVKAR